MRLLQIDAFTGEPFKGNPAAVCFLDGARDDRWMANVAAEMNLSETAFMPGQSAASWVGVLGFQPSDGFVAKARAEVTMDRAKRGRGIDRVGPNDAERHAECEQGSIQPGDAGAEGNVVSLGFLDSPARRQSPSNSAVDR